MKKLFASLLLLPILALPVLSQDKPAPAPKATPAPVTTFAVAIGQKLVYNTSIITQKTDLPNSVIKAQEQCTVEKINANRSVDLHVDITLQNAPEVVIETGKVTWSPVPDPVFANLLADKAIKKVRKTVTIDNKSFACVIATTADRVYWFATDGKDKNIFPGVVKVTMTYKGKPLTLMQLIKVEDPKKK